MAIFSRHIFPR
ncbi:hypothetical protein D020_0658A, partial [Vibrio parahaemolyticus SBR10290]